MKRLCLSGAPPPPAPQSLGHRLAPSPSTRVRDVVALFLLVLLACTRSAPEPTADASLSVTAAPEPWNPKGIDWQPYESGMASAKKDGKPICLVFFTTWCPHCKNYSDVFNDPRLVSKSKKFVMIRLDADANDAISKKYSPDGTYVPRTFLLDPNGVAIPAGNSDHPRYQHFFDEFHADSLVDAMDRALHLPEPMK